MTLSRLSKQVLLLSSFVLGACGVDAHGAAVVGTEQGLTASTTYLVVYKQQPLQQLLQQPWIPASSTADITQAGGTVVAPYPAIGLVVAQSTSETFLANMLKKNQVEGVAPTTGAGVSALPVKFPLFKLPKPPAPQPTGEPLANMQWNMDMIHAAQARAITPGKKSVIVGVLDSGIDDSVPDLQGQVDATRSATCIGGLANTNPAGWRYDAIGHGTHVAGIIGAKQNGVGTVGIAPGVTLAAVKLSEDGFIYPEAVICGLSWAAAHDFDLVNASLFVDPWYYNCPSDPTQKTILTAMQRAISYASSKGVTVIAATSNEQQDLAHPTNDPFSPTDAATIPRTVDSSCKLLPVQIQDVIGVSAVGGDSKLSYYSNYGLGTIDLAAPGGDFHITTILGNPSGQIVSPIPSYSFYYQIANGWNGRVGIGCTDGLDPNDVNANTDSCRETYALLQGTSQATPHVTGVAALILSRFGKMGTSALLAKMQWSATKLPCPSSYQPYPADMPLESCENTPLGLFGNGFYGMGMVDAYNAVR